MGIFDRLRRVIKANVNSAIDRAEDPEKMLNQLIIDMNQQLLEAKKAVATSIADEKRLERQVLEYSQQADDWEKRAILAIEASDQDPSKQSYYEDLAKQALVRHKENDDVAKKLQEQLVTQHAAVDKLKLSLKDLQRRLDESQRRRTLLVARAKRAEAHKKIQEQITGMSDSSAFQAFEKMAQKVDQIEAEADALSEIESATHSTSLEQEFAKLESSAKSDTMLADFKKKIALKKTAPAEIPSSSMPTKQGVNPISTDLDLMMQDLKRKMQTRK